MTRNVLHDWMADDTSSATTDDCGTQVPPIRLAAQQLSPSVTCSLGFGRRRYATRRQLQNAICFVSVATYTKIDRQKMQPNDHISCLIVHRGMLIESGLSNESFMASLSAERREP